MINKNIKIFAKILFVIIGAELGLRMLDFSYYFYYEKLKTYSEHVDENAFRILCVGESTVQGEGTSELIHAFPNQLQKIMYSQYMNRNVAVYNVGIGGIISRRICKNLDANLKYYRPHIIILMICQNTPDLPYFMKRIKNRHLFGFIVRLNNIRLIRMMRLVGTYVRTAGPDAGSLVVEKRNDDSLMQIMYSYRNPAVFENENSNNKLAQYNSEYWTKRVITRLKRSDSVIIVCNYFTSWINDFLKKTSEEKGVLFCDNESIYSRYQEEGNNAEIISEDGWHPNDRGYYLIARNIADIITGEKLINPHD